MPTADRPKPPCLLHPDKEATTVVCLGCGEWLAAGDDSWIEVQTNHGKLIVFRDTCELCGQLLRVAAEAEGLTIESVKNCGLENCTSLPLCDECKSLFLHVQYPEKEVLAPLFETSDPQRALASYIKSVTPWACANFVECRSYHPLVIGCVACGRFIDAADVEEDLDLEQYDDDDEVTVQCECGATLHVRLAADAVSAPNTRNLCRGCIVAWGDDWRDQLKRCTT